MSAEALGLGAQGEGLGPPPPPSSRPPAPAPPEKPDGRFEALLSKLGDLSLVWTDTFASSPSLSVEGYKRLQKMINLYSKDTVLRALEWCVEKQIVPQSKTAVPLLIAICNTIGGPDAD